MIVKLLTKHHLEFLSLKGGYRGLSESTLVKMSNCWKSHAAAQNFILFIRLHAMFHILHFVVCRWSLLTVWIQALEHSDVTNVLPKECLIKAMLRTKIMKNYPACKE